MCFLSIVLIVFRGILWFFPRVLVDFGVYSRCGVVRSRPWSSPPSPLSIGSMTSPRQVLSVSWKKTLILTRDRRNDVCRPMTPTLTLPSQFPCHECCTTSQPSGSLLQVCLVACREPKIPSMPASVLGRVSRSATGCVILGHLHRGPRMSTNLPAVPAKRPHHWVLMTSFLSTGLRRPHRALI